MALTKSLSFSLGRKRVLISNSSCNLELFCADFEPFCADFEPFATPLKRRLCAQEQVQVENFSSKNCSSSLLEALPQELLIKVVCGVDHEDLKQLFHVSKTVRDAAKIAKKWHFAYSTPSKTKAFRDSIEMLNSSDEIEAPNAPMQARKMNRPRLDRKKLGDIAVALFADDDEAVAEEEEVVVEQRWPRRSLFMDIDS